jgi:hypothetical protein
MFLRKIGHGIAAGAVGVTALNAAARVADGGRRRGGPGA